MEESHYLTVTNTVGTTNFTLQFKQLQVICNVCYIAGLYLTILYRMC